MIKPLLIIATLALGTPVLAQPATPRSDARLAADQARNERQSNRVDAGVESGRINEREAAYLDRRVTNTQRASDRLAADGFYSRADAARIDRRQDATSRRTVRAKANRR